ncbi:MAG: Radical domain protein, partial [Ilumatobacteraceae bacterium]|nr:Radical domain protein [Ilumatobacteraceae bacterium]
MSAGGDVVLVVMPFADVNRPALGVSLLKAAAIGAGFSARIEYCNVDLAELVGTEFYTRLADDFPADLLVGEWFFARAVFGDAIAPDEDYTQAMLSAYLPAEAIRDVVRTRALLDTYLDGCVDRIMASRPRVVGFTSTFHQTCASVAVAQRLKAAPHPPVVVFGGANCEGEMGEQLLASFPCIDVVSRGEADHSFVALLQHLVHDGPAPTTGALMRGAQTTSPSSVEQLDALPNPDFDDYFARLVPLHSDLPRQLVLETARGCWWGQRRHCTFCGLNGETMGFRSKSADRAFDEIVDACARYDTSVITFADNILDPAYVDSLFPRLASSGLLLDLFFEVKSNLHREQLAALRAAGVRQIQPGVESLSDEVLRLMRKGVTAFQNIQLLRWATELDVGCSWNIICGFPDETP